MAKSALIILHKGFEELEAIAPIDILRRGEVEVIVASREESLQVRGRNDIVVKADVGLDTALRKNYDCIVLPGGPGTPKLREDPRVLQAVKRHAAEGRLVSAICAAPTVLKDAGLLEGKRYTAHFSVEKELPAIQAAQAVVRDGQIITSRGAGTATEFGLALLEALVSKEKADAVAQSICHGSR